MTIRIGLMAIPTAAVVGLVLLLNGLDTNAGIAATALGVVAVVSGAPSATLQIAFPSCHAPAAHIPSFRNHIDR